ncbi:MAG TPA: MFS transporter [Candidatus Bathyarchaeota archaeon]|nr:MFS transporter [Candidatus Bathyarchaeota archaeon]
MRPKRDAWLLVAMSLPVSLSVGIRSVVLMPYLEELGFPKAQLGLISMASPLAMALFNIPMGFLADVKGRKVLVMAGRLVIAISDVLFFLLMDFYGLLLANFLGGLGASMTSSARSAFLADKAPDEAWRRKLFTASYALFSVGSVLGSLLAGLPDFLLATYGLPLLEGVRQLFLACAVFAITSFLLVAPVEEPKLRQVEGLRLTIRSWDVVWSYALFEVLLGLGGGLVIPWFSWYFYVRFGVLLSDIGFLFAATQGLLAIGNLMASKAASRLGSVKTAVACQLASVGTLLAIPLSPDFIMASCFYVARAVLMNMAWPALRAFYMGLLEPEERASVSAVQNTVFWGSRSLGSYGAGPLMEVFSIDMPFFTCAALYALATLWLFTSFRAREASEHGPRA